MPQRFDNYRFDGVEITPQNTVRVNAVPTRAGVFSYTDTAGKVWNEWRPLAEVARADSLASLEDAPVTIGHPPRGVSPATYGRDSVGHVRAGTPRVDAATGQVSAKLNVSRADAIDRVTRRELVELSAGYDMRLDHTAGTVPAGEPGAGKSYDRVQRDISYNHVALLAPGKGRLGSECSLRLDSAGEQIPGDAPAAETETEETMKFKIKRADGKEVELDAKEAIDVLTAERDALRVRVDGFEKVEAERDAKAAKERRDALEAKCKSLGVEVKPELTDRDLKIAAIKRADAAFDPKDRADAYVDVRFDMLAAPVTTAPAGSAPAPAGSPAAPVLAALNGGTALAQATRADDTEATLELDPAAYAKAVSEKARAGAYNPK